MRVTSNGLTALIIQWVRDNNTLKSCLNIDISEDTDLMAAGLLDSLGFVDLLLFIEDKSGIKVDLTDVDPGEFTVVKGLTNIVLSSSNGDYQQSIDTALALDLDRLPH